jgi:molybdopterin molybdotransferase
MLSVAEAQALIFGHVRPLAAQTVPLSSAAVGLVLAEDVASDLDMPPFDKALMDGFAVRSADLAAGRHVFEVVREIMAGQVAGPPLEAGQAVRIMTGAPLPAAADTVIMVERTRTAEGNRVHFDDNFTRAGTNVLGRGREMRQGEVAVGKGAVLRPQEFGVLATVGRTTVMAYPRPQVSVLCTGDELVEASQVPSQSQIRNGNGPMLVASVARAGGIPKYLGIARDNMESLRQLVRQGLESHVLLLSGGVSAGQRDLVPAVLQEFAVQAHFHKVAMKPGKPVLFGMRNGCLVFGLPGNPVSSLVCFELFVRPALRLLAGQADAGTLVVEAVLQEDFAYRTDRQTYHPAWLDSEAGAWQVRLIPWFGSADLMAVTQANSFAILPVGDNQLKAGHKQPVLRVEERLSR